MSATLIRKFQIAISLVLVLALPGGAVAGDEDRTETEIQYLLDFVAGSQCTFIRNGSAHDPVDAADHLRLKYKRGKKYVNNAGQFIDRLASESSWSGKPYTVDCDGKTEPTRDWLGRALADYRKSGEVIAGQPADPATATPAAPG